MSTGITTRKLTSSDPQMMAEAFGAIGWLSKPVELFHRYVHEQDSSARQVLVAFVDHDFAGYITVNWQPTYKPLVEKDAAELEDLNVLPDFRGRGVATCLIREAENIVSRKCDLVGIGVGLHPGYNAAQRLYVRLGYIPDGHGVTVDDEFVSEGQTVVMDDRLVLHLEKWLRDKDDQRSSS